MGWCHGGGRISEGRSSTSVNGYRPSFDCIEFVWFEFISKLRLLSLESAWARQAWHNLSRQPAGDAGSLLDLFGRWSQRRSTIRAIVLAAAKEFPPGPRGPLLGRWGSGMVPRRLCHHAGRAILDAICFLVRQSRSLKRASVASECGEDSHRP